MEDFRSLSQPNRLYMAAMVELRENLVAYGFYHIDVCEQSPVIIQFQSTTPIRPEPIDGIAVFTSDLYNRVLLCCTAAHPCIITVK